MILPRGRTAQHVFQFWRRRNALDTGNAQYRTLGSNTVYSRSNAQVDQDVGEAEEQHNSLDDGIITTQNGIDNKTPDAGNCEDTFGHDRTADEQRDTNSYDCHDWNGRVLQGMKNGMVALPYSLRLGCSDVILRRHFEHRCPRERAPIEAASDRVPDLSQRRHASHACPRPLRSASCRPAPEASSTSRAKMYGEQLTHDENRDRKAENRSHHQELVDPRPLLPGSMVPSGAMPTGEAKDHHQRRRGSARRAQPIISVDRKIGEDRRSQITPDQMRQPFDEAHEKWPVEAQRNSDALDFRRCRLIAGDDRRRDHRARGRAA